MPLEDIRIERIRKLKILKEKGLNPYPASTNRTHSIAEVIKKFATLSKSKKPVVIAGRVMAQREHGGAVFIDLGEQKEQIQIYLKKDILKDQFELFLETADIGDFIEVEGHAFLTKKGERSIEAKQWAMLAKSLRPLPEKWHGLTDVEERFRKRYLDLLMNPEVRNRFETRAEIIRTVREFHEKQGFLEVETPIFHPIAGGALARPFSTHHNALGTDFYLRIATELYLKRLIIAGFDRVYEIGKDFRNEGTDAQHNPEFSMLECYAAYWDEEDMMEFVEDLFVEISQKFGKRGTIEFDGNSISFKTPFARISFKDLLARYAQITDYEAETRDTLTTRARQFGLEVEKGESKGRIADDIYKKKCRPHLTQPTFVIDHPLELSPLAKRHPDRPQEVQRFQLIVAGLEMTNAFAELNDPLDQRARFEEQAKLRAGGEEEAHRVDEEFLEAMEYGMPPTAGLGIGIDRLVMLFTNTKNIKEVILFPTLKPKEK